jgi:hypothetical protein
MKKKRAKDYKNKEKTTKNINYKKKEGKRDC